MLQVSGIKDMKEEIFGPVLHVATFKSTELDQIIDDINATGYGLTFGMHSRIDDRVEQVTSRLNVGNIYINRNQIGAIVGSQPFGGEGLSGTGPKAGGPMYVKRFTKGEVIELETPEGRPVSLNDVQRAIDAAPAPARLALSQNQLPGPTGESNLLSNYGRGIFLCLGPTLEAARRQGEIVRAHGSTAVMIAPQATEKGDVNGVIDPALLAEMTGFDGVVYWAQTAQLRAARAALGARNGALVPLITEEDFGDRCQIERHICVDTTAAGGNASLLAVAD